MALELPSFSGFDLSGKRALVVGASSGIGLAGAVALAQSGAKVYAAARSADVLAELCAELRARGHDATAVSLDVRESRAVDAVFAEHGPFDVVVNSAGTNRLASMVDVTDEDIDVLFQLNVKAAFYVARAAARTMRDAGIAGSIISVSSQMGVVGNVDRSVYSATKHALEGMTKSLAWDMGKHGIRANTICPTFIETALTGPILERPGAREWFLSQIAFGRPGTVSEVMGPIVFLASDASSLVTGASLLVDGGWSAR